MTATQVTGYTRSPGLDPDMFLSGYITGVHRVTRGHRLAAAAAVGATVLTLDEVADFIEGEGRSQVLVSGDVYDYDDVDPDTNTLTLASPLTVAAAIDDPVDLFDPEVGGTVVVGYEADVMLDDSDPTDRAIVVDISHALTQMLEESERGAFGEKVTLLRTGEHQWSVWQVEGKIAANLAADAAVAAADDAFDQALAALTQAELALAISDGFVDIYYQTSAPWANGSTAHDDDTGDVWVDTDAATPTAYRWLNRTWTAIGDASILAALLAAESAQTTADGKIRLYVQASPPTLVSNPELSYGDLWRETDNDNKEYWWDGDSWEPLLLGSNGIAAVLIGKTLVAGASQTSGERIIMRQDGSGGIIEFFSGLSSEASPGSINPSNNTIVPRIIITSPQRTGYGTSSVDIAGAGPSSLSTVTVTTDVATVTGSLTAYGGFIGSLNGNVTGNLNGNVNGNVTGDLDGDITGGPTISGTVTVNSLSGTGGASLVQVGNGGVLSRGVPISTGAADSGGTGFKVLRTPN